MSGRWHERLHQQADRPAELAAALTRAPSHGAAANGTGANGTALASGNGKVKATKSKAKAAKS